MLSCLSSSEGKGRDGGDESSGVHSHTSCSIIVRIVVIFVIGRHEIGVEDGLTDESDLLDFTLLLA